MGDERPYTTQQKTFTKMSSPNFANSTSPHQVAYASERARMLFGCYRRGDANDPETYVATITAVLARYDSHVIREVTDPNTGIQTTEKFMTFMPNAGELKVYCEAVAARKDRIRKLGELPRPDFTQARLNAPEPAAGDLASVFVPDGHPRYSKLVEWAKTANERMWKLGRSSDNRVGIWIAYDIWMGATK